MVNSFQALPKTFAMNHLGHIEYYQRGGKRWGSKVQYEYNDLENHFKSFIKVLTWLVILNNSSKTYSIIRPKLMSNIVIENMSGRKLVATHNIDHQS